MLYMVDGSSDCRQAMGDGRLVYSFPQSAATSIRQSFLCVNCYSGYIPRQIDDKAALARGCTSRAMSTTTNGNRQLVGGCVLDSEGDISGVFDEGYHLCSALGVGCPTSDSFGVVGVGRGDEVAFECVLQSVEVGHWDMSVE